MLKKSWWFSLRRCPTGHLRQLGDVATRSRTVRIRRRAWSRQTSRGKQGIISTSRKVTALSLLKLFYLSCVACPNIRLTKRAKCLATKPKIGREERGCFSWSRVPRQKRESIKYSPRLFNRYGVDFSNVLVTSRTLALLLCTWQHYSYITKKRNGVQSANCVYDFSVTLLRFSRIQRCWSTHDLIKAQTREGRTYERMQLLKTVDRRSAVAKKRSE